MRNALGSDPQRGKNPYLHLLEGETRQRCRKGLNKSRDKDSHNQLPLAFSEGGWACRGQGNFLFLGWETILEGG